ncbi:unnamed protein product [Chrysodeixis includens]|uniref:Uncharacterized protein n=1 Tax=Chrysodeixis includens TaxID=689277 RepID=A0A9N8KT98_CHRIL|nr:unnamed protein product [Chrysodeixis includens]
MEDDELNQKPRYCAIVCGSRGTGGQLVESRGQRSPASSAVCARALCGRLAGDRSGADGARGEELSTFGAADSGGARTRGAHCTSRARARPLPAAPSPSSPHPPQHLLCIKATWRLIIKHGHHVLRRVLAGRARGPRASCARARRASLARPPPYNATSEYVNANNFRQQYLNRGYPCGKKLPSGNSSTGPRDAHAARRARRARDALTSGVAPTHTALRGAACCSPFSLQEWRPAGGSGPRGLRRTATRHDSFVSTATVTVHMFAKFTAVLASHKS